MARFSPISPQDLRKLERLVGRSQAAALGRKIEARARRAARGTGSQQAAALNEAVIVKELVTKKRAGWVNEPGKSHAVLVEVRTGCLVLDSKRKVITKPKSTLPPKPGINQNVFLQHLKDPNVENFLPYMYQDSEGNVTVGIGHLLRTADDATPLNFIKLGPNVGATAIHIEKAFDRVKRAPVGGNTVAAAFEKLTHIRISEAEAEMRALDKMNEFLGFITQTYFPEFHTFPVLAKMGHLDLAYTSGAEGSRKKYKRFAAAVDRRDWKQAGVEQRDGRKAPRIEFVQAWYNQAAQQEPFFISHTKCRKPISRLMK
jgi:hypothetical protein